jgi:hypothetical protein
MLILRGYAATHCHQATERSIHQYLDRLDMATWPAVAEYLKRDYYFADANPRNGAKTVGSLVNCSLSQRASL